jgi:hypothetical protein
MCKRLKAGFAAQPMEIDGSLMPRHAVELLKGQAMPLFCNVTEELYEKSGQLHARAKVRSSFACGLMHRSKTAPLNHTLATALPCCNLRTLRRACEGRTLAFEYSISADRI